MGSVLELGVLFSAIGAVLYLVADGAGGDLRRRRERAHVERVAGEKPEHQSVERKDVLSARLKAAGLAGPAAAYIAGEAVAATLVGIFILRLLPAVPIAGLVGAALAVYLLWTAINEWGKHRARMFEQRLIGAIDLMTGALYAGASLGQALRGAAAAADATIRREFEESARRLALGMSIDRAFGRFVEVYPGEGVCLFTQTLAAKHQAGGDLAPTLKSLNETLRDRWRFHREIRSQLGGARLTAIVGVLLPYGLTALLAWQQPHWFDSLMVNPLGPPLIGFAVLLQLIGVLWVAHILTREF